MAAVNDAPAGRGAAPPRLVGARRRARPNRSTSPAVDGLANLAEQHRVTGVVLAALDDGAATGVPAELIDDLADRHLRLLQQSLMAEADLVFVARLFQDAGIEFRVLKGCATAHLDYPDPALRLTSDVDLLVRRGQLDAATEVLRPYVDIRTPYPTVGAVGGALRQGPDDAPA